MMFPSNKGLFRFLAILGATYVLLIVPWPGMEARFADIYRTIGDNLIGGGLFGGRVQFVPQAEGSTVFDTKLVLQNYETKARKEIPYSSRFGAYLPIATLIALVLATPLPWPRRLTTLLCGLLAMGIFITLRHCLLLLVGYSANDLVSTLKLGAFPRRILVGVCGFLTMAPLSNVMVPALAWLALWALNARRSPARSH